MGKDFRITMGKGFQMKFPNGVVASVQWGQANYCERRKMVLNAKEVFAEADEARLSGLWDSNDAEVCAWVDKPGTSFEDNNSIIQKLYPNERDIVMGHLSAMEVLDFLNKCSKY